MLQTVTRILTSHTPRIISTNFHTSFCHRHPVNMSNTVVSKHLIPAIDIGGSLTKLVIPLDEEEPILSSEQQAIKRSTQIKLNDEEFGGLHVDVSHANLSLFTFQTVESCIEFMKNHVHQGISTAAATGGGSVRDASMFEEHLGIKLQPYEEVASLVRGLDCLISYHPEKIFSLKSDQVELPRAYHGEPSSLHRADIGNASGRYPFMVVNIGSGVSIVRVDDRNKFSRVSGSCVGGGTFLGLCKMLTGLGSFDDIAKALENGRGDKVDLLVEDIYGREGVVELGLPAELTAASFGKVANALGGDTSSFDSADVVASVAFMVTVNLAQITTFAAEKEGITTVYFTGGFVEGCPAIWKMLSEGLKFWSQGKIEARFSELNSELGSLGAYALHLDCLRSEEF